MSDPMEVFRARFRDRCRDELPILRDPAHPDFHRTVHKLNGAAGTFGYPQISALADHIDQALSNGGDAEPEAVEALTAAVEDLVRPA